MPWTCCDASWWWCSVLPLHMLLSAYMLEAKLRLALGRVLGAMADDPLGLVPAAPLSDGHPHRPAPGPLIHRAPGSP